MGNGADARFVRLLSGSGARHRPRHVRENIDDNGAERAPHAVAVDRKNGIFFVNERGGEAAAVMYSLSATCNEHDVDPRTYLGDGLLRSAKTSNVRELIPYGWKARWQKVVEQHRASILERIALQLAG